PPCADALSLHDALPISHSNTADPSIPGTGIGGTNSSLEMANTIVKGFVESRRTHFIYQPAIGSFFEGGQYSFKELVSARDPWSRSEEHTSELQSRFDLV